MKIKQEIVENWFQRYKKIFFDSFIKYILLINLKNYVQIFALYHENIYGRDEKKTSATANDVTILSFGIGSSCVTILSI